MNKTLIPRAPRVRFVQPVWLQPVDASEKSERLVSQNLSVGGMFIESKEAPTKGAQYELLLESKGKAFRLARAEVVWQGRQPSSLAEGFGVRFVEVRPRAKELLEYLVGQSQMAEQRAAEKNPSKPAPVEVIFFHPPPKNVKKPEVVYEATRTGMFEMPRIQTSVDMPALSFEKPQEQNELTDDTLVELALQPSRRWAWFLGFTVLGALGVMMVGLLRTPPTVEVAPGPEIVETPKAPEAAVQPPMVVEEPMVEESPSLPEAPTTLALSGAASKIELVVVENTVDVEVFLARRSTIQRWFMLQGPPRMVIDIKGLRPQSLANETLAGGLLVRTGKTDTGTRLVFDLPQLPLQSKREGTRFLLTFPR